MKKELKPTNKLGRKVLLASAISLSMVAAPTFAQGNNANQELPKFQTLDENRNQNLEWNEIDEGLGDRLGEANMDRDAVLNQYDRDKNKLLNADEYAVFIVALEKQGQNTAQREQQDSQNAEVVMQSQQPRIAVDTAPAQVQVDQAKPNVTVDQKAPKIAVDQAEPQVTVDQKKPKVIVNQPEPKISVTNPEPKVEVNIPKPEVKVVQPNPDVNVEQARPQIEVTQPKPEVSVTQPKPKVSVDQPAPEVAVQPARPEVVVDDDTAQAQVDVKRERAQVNVREGEQPEVAVNEADPNVNIQEAEGARINIDQEEAEVVMQDRETGADVAAAEEDFDPENLPATAAGTPPEQNMDMSGIYDVKIDDLEGKNVVNSNGEEIGEIDSVVTSRDMTQMGVVVSMGGFLGSDLGDNNVFLPINKLQMVNDQLVYQSAENKNQLKQTADFNEQEYLRVESENFPTLRDVQEATP